MRIEKVAVLVFSVGVFSWLGCGGDGVCDKADQASKHLTNAAAGCSGSDAGVFSVSYNFSYNKAACQNALSSCSADDQKALSKAFDCLSSVNRCVPGQENQFGGSVIACVITAGNISSACQTALSRSALGFDILNSGASD